MTPFVKRDDGFLYEQIATHVSTLIENRTLQPGDALPSVREMSRSRGVSISTVMNAYRLLEDRGLVTARPKSGFYVRDVKRSPIAEPSVSEPSPSAPSPGVSPSGYQKPMLDLARALSDPDVVSLGAALPAPEHLPSDALGRHLARAARRPDHQLPAYDPLGDADLRRAVAQRALLGGCTLDPDALIVTNGCTEALAVCLRAVTQPGDTVAVESPTYFGLLLLLEKLDLRVHELPTSPQTGVSLDAAEAALASGSVDALLLIPSFNNPIGSCMPPAHRERIYELITRHDVPLIEDDVYGDLHFGDTRPQPIKALDTDGRVLYCRSVSKTIAPGYRVGFTAPGRYHDAVLAEKTALSIATARPMQRALADYLTQPGHEKRLRTLRRTYRDTVARMRALVGEVFPNGTRVTNPDGGFLLWVEMPETVDATLLAQRAREEGISVAPGPLFSCCACYDSCLRLNAGVAWTARTRAALHTLGHLAHHPYRVPEPPADAASCTNGAGATTSVDVSDAAAACC